MEADTFVNLASATQAVEWYREDLVGQAMQAGSIPHADLFLSHGILLASKQMNVIVDTLQISTGTRMV